MDFIESNQLVIQYYFLFVFFLNYASRCVLNYKDRNIQITIENNFFYKSFIQLHVSTSRGYHQAGF